MRCELNTWALDSTTSLGSLRAPLSSLDLGCLPLVCAAYDPPLWRVRLLDARPSVTRLHGQMRKKFSASPSCNSHVQSMLQRTRRIRRISRRRGTAVPPENCAQRRACAGLPPARFNATSPELTGLERPKHAARVPAPAVQRSARHAPFPLLPAHCAKASLFGFGHTGGEPMSKRALTVTREQNFPEWYQAVVRDGDMAETSPVRGCMMIKPWG